MDAGLGKASIAVRATLDKLDQDLAGARQKTDSVISKITKGAGKQFQTLGKVALGGIGLATAAVTGLAAGLGKVAMDAAPVEGIADAFEGIAESAGTSQEEMLSALEEGSSGMIAQRDLMLSFNKAAGLVSEDFATQLPDAMGYLSKVSAATGEDMGYMMDSLVTGVGRMSPMILDNLGIQVSLAEATANAAEEFGVEESALTDAQKQTGMMNVVLEKLAKNTESMPDVTESASAKMAQLKATIQDTKDQIGVALLPTLGNLMGGFAKLTDRILPPLVGFIEDTLAPALQTISGVVNDFFWLLDTGEEPLDALQGALEMAFGPEVATQIMRIVDRITDFVDRVRTAVQPVLDWISENVELKDILIGLGAAIASVLIPILIGIVSTLAPIIAVFAAVSLAVAGLRKAWETNFLGIRDWVLRVFPIVRQWLAENIPVAIEKAKQFWTNTLLPALQRVGAFIETRVIPILAKVVAWLRDNIPIAIQKAKQFWENTLQPALQTVWTFIDKKIIPIFKTISDWLGKKVPKAGGTLSDFWEETLLPALEDVWAFIDEKVIPILKAVAEVWLALVKKGFELLVAILRNVVIPALQWLWDKFKKVADFIWANLGPAINWLKDKVFGPLATTISDITGGVEGLVGWLETLADKINSIQLPSWLQRGSLPPLAQSMYDISEGIRAINSMRMPDIFDARMEAGLAVSGGGTIAMSALGGERTRGISMGDINIDIHATPDMDAQDVGMAVRDELYELFTELGEE